MTTANEVKIKVAQKKDFTYLSKMDPSYKEFGSVFNDQDSVCLIILNNRKPVGYLLYQIHVSWYDLMWVFVKEDYRRKGFASAAIHSLSRKICGNSSRRGFISVVLKDRDSIDTMQKTRFLRRCGFEVQSVDVQYQGQIVLHVNRPEIAVNLIKKRNRSVPYFPQYLD